jgi:hypothetical protein
MDQLMNMQCNARFLCKIYLNINTKQAGAELCQTQIKLGLAKIEIFFHLNEN